MQDNVQEMQTTRWLDKIDALLDAARKVPLSNLVMVDRDEIGDMIGQLRGVLPSDIKAAQQLMRQQSEILADANNQAQNTIATAKLEDAKLRSEAKYAADTMVNDAQRKAAEAERIAGERASGILLSAREQADALLRQAHEQADYLVSEQEVLHRAQIEADEVLHAADEKSREMRVSRMNFVLDMLEDIEQILAEKTNEISVCRANIEQQR